MRKLIFFMHVSLDGFVAGPNGEMDWIKVDEDLFDIVGEQTDQADIGLYGRITYEIMESYWPTAGDKPNATRHDIQHATWYKNITKVIISKTLQNGYLSNTKIISSNIPSEIIQLKQTPGKNIILFGSSSAAHTLMENDLIDEYWIFVNPIILGQGKPLYKEIQKKIKLKLIATHTFSSGVVCLHYERNPNFPA